MIYCLILPPSLSVCSRPLFLQGYIWVCSVLLGTRIIMNKPAKEINVFNTLHYEVSHEEWQYNIWQKWPAILPQYCFSVIICCPNTSIFHFTFSLSLTSPPPPPLTPIHLSGWKDGNQSALTFWWWCVVTPSLSMFKRQSSSEFLYPSFISLVFNYQKYIKSIIDRISSIGNNQLW